MTIIMFLLKHWRIGGVVLLAAAFLISAHLAGMRGDKLKQAEAALKTERANFEAQMQSLKKARQNEKERDGFRKKQNKKIKLADDTGLRDAYDILRERHSGYTGN